jgi:methylated-DNA-[protein]-cysteine S-methyltransferase
MNYTTIDTPIGPLLLAGNGAGLRLINFQNGSHSRQPEPHWVENEAAFSEVKRQLDAYFAAELRDFDLDLAPEGTSFQLAVWRELRRIPYGTTISYAELARRIGRPQSVRAVGAANGANPLPIVIPCHRVIGTDGSLTGYGGGLEIKEALLGLEGARLALA